MTRRRLLVWVVAASAASAIWMGFAAAVRAETWYAQRLTGGDTPMRVEHFWSKGRKLRAQTVIGGYPITTIVSGEFYYIIDPLRRAGIGIRRNALAIRKDKELSNQRPFGNEGRVLIAAGAERIRTQRIAGRETHLYRLTDEGGRREGWVTADEVALPLRLEAFDRASGATVRTDYVDWARELKLPDSFFEPDPGIELQRFEYEEYVKRAAEGPIGPAPILHADLFHGR